MKYSELIYICGDLSKSITSDDSYFNEDHIRFLVNKHRAQLLFDKYKNNKENIPDSNYHTLCLGLEDFQASCNDVCDNGIYLRSVQKIPVPMTIGSKQIFTNDYYSGNITWVSRERMRYVGENKYMKNILYASLGPDDRIYLKSRNPLFNYLEGIRFTAVFEDAEKASELECTDECPMCDECDIMEKEVKIEEGLIPQLILTVVQELTGSKFNPKDYSNNASDDLENLASFIRQNMKSQLAKQMTE